MMKVAAWNYGLLNHNQNTTKLFTLRENMTFLEADSAVFFLEPFLNQDNCWVHQFNPPPRQRVNPCIRNDHYHIFQSRPMLFHLKVDKTFGVFRRQKISCQMIILKKRPTTSIEYYTCLASYERLSRPNTQIKLK